MTGAFVMPVQSGTQRRASYTGLYAFLVSVVMFFAGFTSAMVVRRSAAKDWKPVPMLDILWANTAALAVSSVLVEKARRDLRAGERTRFTGGWTAATVLGVGFLAGQILLWRQLRDAGVYMSANPGGAFFYVGTIAHALHLVGGLLAMLYLCYRAWRLQLGPGRRTAVDVTAIYWHFLGFLWLYLLGLFWFWGR